MKTPIAIIALCFCAALSYAKTGDDADITSTVEMTRGPKSKADAAKALRTLEDYEPHVAKSKNPQIKNEYWNQRIWKAKEADPTTSALAVVNQALASVTTPSQSLLAHSARESCRAGLHEAAAQSALAILGADENVSEKTMKMITQYIDVSKIKPETRAKLRAAIIARKRIDDGQTLELMLWQRLNAAEKVKP